MPNFKTVPYNDLGSLDAALSDPDVCAYFVEPVQGEGGVIVPDEGYLKGVRDICTKRNVLFICDEVQAGMGRTGHDAAWWHEGPSCKPDVMLLAKSLTGGLLPASAVLANDDVMLNVAPNEHGSTFGGNPLACKVATAAINVMIEEGISENARIMGERFRGGLREVQGKWGKDVLKDVRGRGLMNAIELNSGSRVSPWSLSLLLRDNGVLAKPTRNVIRFTPPCVIDENAVDMVIDGLDKAIGDAVDGK